MALLLLNRRIVMGWYDAEKKLSYAQVASVVSVLEACAAVKTVRKYALIALWLRVMI